MLSIKNRKNPLGNLDIRTPIPMNKNQKNTLKKSQKLAKFKGGKCLSKEYINHRKYWCPECCLNKKGSIEKMQLIAESRGGSCRSKVYTNCITKLECECNEGHKWKATPSNIKQGTWCIICAIAQRTERNKKAYFEKLKQNAKSKNGKCLSKKFVNSFTKLEWECKEGHRWKTIPSTIQKGNWCPECRKIRIDKLRKQWKADKKKLLRTLYGKHTNPVQKISKIKKKKIHPQLEKMQQIAKSKGGKCLSMGYNRRKSKLEWECAKGHRWKTAPLRIQMGNWCPECNKK